MMISCVHYCLVTEIFFWPPGTIADPIPAGATPASSDRLAQRNLSFDSSGNPGWPSTHTVQHTMMIKPSNLPIDVGQAEAVREGVTGPDELIIEWGNVPRGTEATLFFPELDANEILALSLLRQHPVTLEKIDVNTISVKVADVSFIPLPARAQGNLAGLLTLTLPQGVRPGQLFKMSVQQCSGTALKGRARKTLGAYQFNIPVSADPEILPKAVHSLSILRYIQQTIPAGSRWAPVFTHWLTGLAGKVSGLGGDPGQVLPSPTGGDTAPPCPEPEPEPEPCEGKPRGLLCMNIPWDECDVEGEMELKMRFRKRGE